MSLIALGRERRAIDASVFNIGLLGSPRTKAGETITFDKAVGIATAWACITLITDSIYQLPVDTFRRRGEEREEVDPPVIVASPSLLVSARDWRVQAVMSLLGWGNAYGQILVRDRAGRPEIVEWIDPSQVHVSQKSAFAPPVYRVAGREIPSEEIVHLRRFARPGTVVGMSPLDTQRETLGLSIAIRNFAAEWFGDGAHPSAILSTEADLNDPDGLKARTIKERFRQAIRGREPAIMGKGWKYTPVQTSPGDSEMSELANQTAIAVCQTFRVPPEMLGISTGGSSVTYANREQRSIDFLTYTLAPWLTVLEDFWTQNLEGSMFARFNTGALLRSDLATRYRAHGDAIRAGWLSRNEVRRIEDRPSIGPEGDAYLWPPHRTVLVAEDLE